MKDDSEIRVTAEFEAEDTLAVRLARLKVEGPPRNGPVNKVLERQTRRILDDVNYLDGELALIEVDGPANAVQLRSKKPDEGKFAEIVLRGGNAITVEGKGHAVHVSREDYGKLVDLLSELVSE